MSGSAPPVRGGAQGGPGTLVFDTSVPQPLAIHLRTLLYSKISSRIANCYTRIFVLVKVAVTALPACCTINTKMCFGTSVKKSWSGKVVQVSCEHSCHEGFSKPRSSRLLSQPSRRPKSMNPGTPSRPCHCHFEPRPLVPLDSWILVFGTSRDALTGN